MGRYLLLGLAIWGALLIIRHLSRQRRLRHQRTQPAKSVDSVQCAYCGLHLPRSEAVFSKEAAYCSKDHLKADQT